MPNTSTACKNITPNSNAPARRQDLMGHVERHVLRLQPGGGVLGLITWRWSSRQPSPLERLAEDQAGELGMGLATAESLHLLGVGCCGDSTMAAIMPKRRCSNSYDRISSAILPLITPAPISWTIWPSGTLWWRWFWKGDGVIRKLEEADRHHQASRGRARHSSGRSGGDHWSQRDRRNRST